MLGATLLAPWARVLERNGASVACLTSLDCEPSRTGRESGWRSGSRGAPILCVMQRGEVRRFRSRVVRQAADNAPSAAERPALAKRAPRPPGLPRGYPCPRRRRRARAAPASSREHVRRRADRSRIAWRRVYHRPDCPSYTSVAFRAVRGSRNETWRVVCWIADNGPHDGRVGRILGTAADISDGRPSVGSPHNHQEVTR
jgi:hypothetical protein